MAVAFVYLTARTLGARAPVAAAAALALSAGRMFWFNSLIAEVYTLNAALWAAAAFALARWEATRRNGHLYAAVGCIASGAGNHLTILSLLPAALLGVVLARRLGWRVLVVCALLLIAGAAQYAFIWVRTLQGGAYLESVAYSLDDLVQVMTARRFSSLMFAFTPETVVTDRIPALATLVQREIGLVGFGAAIVGVVLLAYRRPIVAMMLLVGTSGVLVMTVNVVGDVGGFLLPAFTTLWVLAAVGLEWVFAAASARHRAGTAVAGTTALLLPATQVYANCRVNDQSGRRSESRFFRALYRQLPPKAVLVTDNSYNLTPMIDYGRVTPGEYLAQMQGGGLVVAAGAGVDLPPDSCARSRCRLPRWPPPSASPAR